MRITSRFTSRAKRSATPTSTRGLTVRATKRTTSARGARLRSSIKPPVSPTSTSGRTAPAAASNSNRHRIGSRSRTPRQTPRRFALCERGVFSRAMTLYHDHLKYVRECTDRALAETAFDHVVIAAGALHVAFLDDNTYPFRANPHFKWWVPIVDNPNCLIVYTPGEKPRLVYYQPVDYWYKPAGAPRGFWVDSFDIRVIGDAKEAEQHLPKSGSIAYIAENGAPASAGPSEKPSKAGAPNPEPLLHR